MMWKANKLLSMELDPKAAGKPTDKPHTTDDTKFSLYTFPWLEAGEVVLELEVVKRKPPGQVWGSWPSCWWRFVHT
jgi:hypothetical protein